MGVEDCIRSDLILISARGQQIDISTLSGESKHVTPEIDSRPFSPTKFRCITSDLTHAHTMVCLCGYDANSDHCHLLSMPPSPNDFYENFWAPTFTELLEGGLRTVPARHEPSKRIQWRRVFGGDAQDEPLLDV